MMQKYKTIDEYIAQFPPEVQQKLQEMRAVIKEAAPEATEAIAYQMPTFKLDGKNLVHFAAFKGHIGFFPTPSGIEAFGKELEPFRTGKGTIRFGLQEPIPFDLVKKVVLARVKESKEGSDK